ncbi:hypothetical protein FA09DRAFT_327206 [Tilletiopsis washingtonensis]|uniref:Mitochondrial import inner membrane translocase subunit n=1 Tax=Tilletiopsis washingtonensis TaxID=58919 RepID=A0A316ZJF9_9BASI|nr:hypothetical protein FA09DRAFT_327206 [Tilletiopsis washingtonensis]PWO01259.1 hypothetical protein FA09DRAFT_327206 [Tilletiopsis washingtonensis]
MSSGPTVGAGVGSAQLDAAVQELDMITDVFNRLVSSCHAKCIATRYAEPDLNKGESVCIDRCTAKFFATNAKVGELMNKMGGGGAQQQGNSGGMGFF